jgi:hypothetical protein
MRRLNKKAQEKGKELPIPNYHIAHKKDRKYGTGVKYDQKAGSFIILDRASDELLG